MKEADEANPLNGFLGVGYPHVSIRLDLRGVVGTILVCPMIKGYFNDLEPYVQKMVKKDLWRVIQKPSLPFYWISTKGLITAPVHEEETDLGSVPEVVRWIVDKDEWVPAFLVHDNLCFRRFALMPKFPYIPGDDNLRDLICRYVFEPDEVKRMKIARENFEVLRVDRPGADWNLNEAIYTFAPEDNIRRRLVYRSCRIWGGKRWNTKGEQRDTALRTAWLKRAEENTC